MLDTSAFEVAGYEPVHASPAPTDAGVGERTMSPPVIGCLACQRTLGACAFHLAEQGSVSPMTALTVCGAMQRMVRRAMSPRTTSVSGYLACVWLGPSRRERNLEAEAETLAERIL